MMNQNPTIKPRMLICDDSQTDRDMIIQMFKDTDYQFTEATNGKEALDLLKAEKFDVILLNVSLPEIDGYEVFKRIRSDDIHLSVPVILITRLDEDDTIIMELEPGATDYITKPFTAVEIKARVAAAIEYKYVSDRLDDAESVLFSLARMVEARDKSTGDHCDRLSHMSVVFGRELGLSHAELEGLRCGGVLHDIGKLGIPDMIPLKDGKLDSTEWEAMRMHPTIGATLCKPLRTMNETIDIVRYHHERQDGSGYPSGLEGKEIPLLARVFQIVDIYDALSSERPYKKALPKEEVVAIMQGETIEGFWDAALMDQFLNIVKTRPEILDLPSMAAQDRHADIFDELYSSGIVRHYHRS